MPLKYVVDGWWQSIKITSPPGFSFFAPFLTYEAFLQQQWHFRYCGRVIYRFKFNHFSLQYHVQCHECESIHLYLYCSGRVFTSIKFNLYLLKKKHSPTLPVKNELWLNKHCQNPNILASCRRNVGAMPHQFCLSFASVSRGKIVILMRYSVPTLYNSSELQKKETFFFKFEMYYQRK